VKKFILWSALVFASLMLAGGIFFYTPDIEAQNLKSKYTNSYSKFIQTPEALVHYRDQGPRDAQVLLLIHGSNSSLHTWDGVADILDDKYRVISVDLLGHGLTGPNRFRRYNAAAMIKSVNAVLDQAGVRQAVWVGNSMGGWVAWRAALLTPNRVKALVLVDASGAQTTEKIKPYIGAQLAANPIGRMFLVNFSPRFLVSKSLAQTVANPAVLTAPVIDRYWELLRYPGNRQAVIDRASEPRQDEVWNEIRSISAPTLIVWGEKDNIIPLSHSRAFHAQIKGSTVVVMNNAGHLPMEESPNEFATILNSWLEQIN